MTTPKARQAKEMLLGRLVKLDKLMSYLLVFFLSAFIFFSLGYILAIFDNDCKFECAWNYYPNEVVEYCNLQGFEEGEFSIITDDMRTGLISCTTWQGSELLGGMERIVKISEPLSAYDCEEFNYLIDHNYFGEPIEKDKSCLED